MTWMSGWFRVVYKPTCKNQFSRFVFSCLKKFCFPISLRHVPQQQSIGTNHRYGGINSFRWEYSILSRQHNIFNHVHHAFWSSSTYFFFGLCNCVLQFCSQLYYLYSVVYKLYRYILNSTWKSTSSVPRCTLAYSEYKSSNKVQVKSRSW